MKGQPPLKKNKKLFSVFQRADRPTESTTSDGLTKDNLYFHQKLNNSHPQIRVAYLKAEPYQLKLVEYPKTQGKSQSRRFQAQWNFLEMIKILTETKAEIDRIILKNTPKNAQYITSTKEVDVIWEFISHLDNIINIITSFHKHIIDLQSTQRNEIEHMLATGECESERGANQRDDDWEEFLQELRKFCSKHDIEIPDLESLYKAGPCRSRDQITTDHHYHFDFFNETIDSLGHFELDMKSESRFQVSTVVELCQRLTESGKLETHTMVTRLILLVLTLSISTVTTE
ncbi:uncharacterized protein LOC111370068 [Olea europaea var. sylvestris]|uniref:uncharacterized protein LOC111370068 n=1 Tax=Olea europaea var. sylvestris TaxID=158386 RepID=UPI000C1D04E6|nr:uncharacterized protein LOC111370068 [Olea europaea var. sylvestris]